MAWHGLVSWGNIGTGSRCAALRRSSGAGLPAGVARFERPGRAAGRSRAARVGAGTNGPAGHAGPETAARRRRAGAPPHGESVRDRRRAAPGAFRAPSRRWPSLPRACRPAVRGAAGA
ncbi:hypothetical protein DF050_00455 [Burkholderia cepacia]|nr:hypothetical protein DF050_00455 [Burkholderia cepacia]